MTEDYIGIMVEGIIDDNTEIENLIESLKSEADISDDELKEKISEAFDNDIDVYDLLYQTLDWMIMSYSDAKEIIDDLEYYSGWDEIIDNELGGKCEDIMQLAYGILLQEFNNNDGNDMLIQEIITLIRA